LGEEFPEFMLPIVQEALGEEFPEGRRSSKD
jgi:hypothetical protein